MCAADDTVFAIAKDKTIVRFAGVVVAVAWISVKVIGAHHDTRASFDQEIVSVPLPKRIAADGHVAAVTQVNVYLHVAEHIPGNGDVTLLHVIVAATGRAAAQNADVRRIR